VSHYRNQQTGGVVKNLKEATIARLILLAVTRVAVIIASTGMGYINVPAEQTLKSYLQGITVR
jgi:hypothetical protein